MDVGAPLEKVSAAFATVPRELSGAQLAGYASSVFPTAGDQAGSRYFLPRILDLEPRFEQLLVGLAFSDKHTPGAEALVAWFQSPQVQSIIQRHHRGR